MVENPEEVATSTELRESRPWGLWSTIGLSCLIAGAFFVAQFVVVVGFIIAAMVRNPELDIASYAESLSSDGFVLAIATVLSTTVCVPLIVLFVHLRRGFSIKDYLCLRSPTNQQLLWWALLLVMFIAISDSISYLFDHPVVPPFMVDAYQTSRFAPLFLIALIVMAPVSEELFWRGFLFKGLKYSRLGGAGAIVLTALGWSLLHVQYDAYNVIVIFILGIILGIARLKTHSTCLTILLHCLCNLVGTVEVILHVHLAR